MENTKPLAKRALASEDVACEEWKASSSNSKTAGLMVAGTYGQQEGKASKASQSRKYLLSSCAKMLLAFG